MHTLSLHDALPISSELVTAEALAQAGFIERTVSGESLTSPAFAEATGVTLLQEELATAGLLNSGIDPDDLEALGLATRDELRAFGLRPTVDTSLIRRENLDDLPRVDYDALHLEPVQLAYLLASGRLFGQELLDRNPLVDLNDIARNRFPTRTGLPIATDRKSVV